MCFHGNSSLLPCLPLLYEEVPMRMLDLMRILKGNWLRMDFGIRGLRILLQSFLPASDRWNRMRNDFSWMECTLLSLKKLVKTSLTRNHPSKMESIRSLPNVASRCGTSGRFSMCSIRSSEKNSRNSGLCWMWQLRIDRTTKRSRTSTLPAPPSSDHSCGI